MRPALLAVALIGTATGRAADAPLDVPVSAVWTGLPLRAWAERASAAAGRPVIVDRRLDPDTTVTRTCREEPLGDLLAAVAGATGTAVEPLESWIRLAPVSCAGRAAAGERRRVAEIAALPAAARKPLAARHAWTWADGARPRDLVAGAATAAKIDVAGLELIPHDHLPGADLGPLALCERLDLVLAHYDLRVAWTLSRAATPVGRIVPLEAAVANVAPAADDRIAPRRPPATPRPAVATRFTLRLEAPLDEALQQLAPQLGLEPALDRASLAARGIQPGEIVRAAVADASRDQLLDAIVGPLGLRWRIEGRRLVVDAPPP
jgi:hypothetical protein